MSEAETAFVSFTVSSNAMSQRIVDLPSKYRQTSNAKGTLVHQSFRVVSYKQDGVIILSEAIIFELVIFDTNSFVCRRLWNKKTYRKNQVDYN